MGGLAVEAIEVVEATRFLVEEFSFRGSVVADLWCEVSSPPGLGVFIRVRPLSPTLGWISLKGVFPVEGAGEVESWRTGPGDSEGDPSIRWFLEGEAEGLAPTSGKGTEPQFDVFAREKQPVKKLASSAMGTGDIRGSRAKTRNSMRGSVTLPRRSEARDLRSSPIRGKSSTPKRIARIIEPTSRRFRESDSLNSLALVERDTPGFLKTPTTCVTNSGKQKGFTNLKQFKEAKKTV